MSGQQLVRETPVGIHVQPAPCVLSLDSSGLGALLPAATLGPGAQQHYLYCAHSVSGFSLSHTHTLPPSLTGTRHPELTYINVCVLMPSHTH